MNGRAIAMLATAVSCAHAPYRADATVVSDGKLLIRSAPDADETSEGLALQYAHSRASEACPSGYDIVESNVSSVRSTERVAVFGRRVNERPEIVLVVRCKDPTTKAGSPPEAPNKETIDHVGGTDAQPGVSVTANPAAGDSCHLVSKIRPLETFFGNLPPDTDEDQLFDAALQFLVSSGIDVDVQDRAAHTIVSKWFTGQTVVATCSTHELNEYRDYRINVAIVGKRMVVGMDCRRAFGMDRTPMRAVDLSECPSPVFAGNESDLPGNLFEGSVGMLDLRRTRPGTSSSAHWWCFRGRFTCFRQRADCIKVAKGDACEPQQRAYCQPASTLCTGEKKACELAGNACIYEE